MMAAIKDMAIRIIIAILLFFTLMIAFIILNFFSIIILKRRYKHIFWNFYLF